MSTTTQVKPEAVTVQVSGYKSILPALEDVFVSLVEESRKEQIREELKNGRIS